MTRQLLEDIKSQLLGEGKKENQKVFGLTVEVEEIFANPLDDEYTHMVRYKGKAIGYYDSKLALDPEMDNDNIIAQWEFNGRGGEAEFDEQHDAVEFIVAGAVNAGLSEAINFDKIKQMAMKVLKKAKKPSSKAKKAFSKKLISKRPKL